MPRITKWGYERHDPSREFIPCPGTSVAATAPYTRCPVCGKPVKAGWRMIIPTHKAADKNYRRKIG